MNGWKRRWMRLARDKVLSLISLATKAGRCASGEFMTEGQTKSGRASLVVVAEDASDNTKKKFRDMCKFYKVPMIVYGDKDTLGHAMGKQFRASLAILDEGFAKGIHPRAQQGRYEPHPGGPPQARSGAGFQSGKQHRAAALLAAGVPEGRLYPCR